MLRCLILIDCPTPWNGNSQSVSNEPRRYQRKLAIERSEAVVHNMDAGQQTDNMYSSKFTPFTRTTAQDDSDKHSLNWSNGRSQIAIESIHACYKLKTVTYIMTYSSILGSRRTNQVINLSLLRNTQTTSYIRGRIHGLGCETIILSKWQRLEHNSNEPTTAANCDHHTTPRSRAILCIHTTWRRLPVMGLS